VPENLQLESEVEEEKKEEDRSLPDTMIDYHVRRLILALFRLGGYGRIFRPNNKRDEVYQKGPTCSKEGRVLSYSSNLQAYLLPLEVKTEQGNSHSYR